MHVGLGLRCCGTLTLEVLDKGLPRDQGAWVCTFMIDDE